MVPDFGGIPHVSLPQVRPDLIVPLLPAAVTVAMLAAIESLLSAVVADNMSSDRHNSNVELHANLAVPFVRGIPAICVVDTGRSRKIRKEQHLRALLASAHQYHPIRFL